MRTLGIATTVILAIVISAASPVRAAANSVLASKSDQVYTLEDFDIFYMKQLGARGLVTFLEQMVVYEEARKLGLTPTKEEIDSFIKNDMSPDIYSGFQQLYSQSALDRFVEYTIMNRKYREHLEQKFIKEKNIRITDDDARKYYVKNIDRFQLPERAQLSIISVEDEKTAKEVLGRLDKGEDFNQLAAIYNTDEELRTNSGYVGVIGKGMGLPEPIEKMAFAVEPGKHSDIIRGTLFHIIFVHNRFPAKNYEFADVKEDIKQFLREQEVEHYITEHINKLYQEQLPKFEIKAELFKAGEAEVSKGAGEPVPPT